MRIREVELNEMVLSKLVSLSEDWERENCCWGYQKNARKDIDGNRVFVAWEEDKIIGYLFGHKKTADKSTAIYQRNESYFEIEELYVKPEYRNKGIGTQLFQFVEELMKDDVHLMMLGTAAKNYRAILHFYIEELGMEFWSAALFKRI